MNKKKIIVYGLGEQYKRREKFLEQTYDIVGYSDSKKVDVANYIEPSKLKDLIYDYIYITSIRYYDEIVDVLVNTYHVDKDKVTGEKNSCWYIDNTQMREQWVKQQLEKLPAGSRLLDAGAGEMPYKKFCNHLDYIAQDFGEYDNSEKVEGLQHNIWDTSKVNIVSDIIDIPLEDYSVDAVLCTEVLEHIKNPILALHEFSRLIKKGGCLLLTAPFCSLTHFAPYYFSNGFSKYWYEENLRDVGFEIEEIVANGNYFDYIRQELLRLVDMEQRYCKNSVGQEVIEDSIMSTLLLLEKMSKEDRQSQEVLCFGYMVKAKKIK